MPFAYEGTNNKNAQIDCELEGLWQRWENNLNIKQEEYPVCG